MNLTDRELYFESDEALSKKDRASSLLCFGGDFMKSKKEKDRINDRDVALTALRNWFDAHPDIEEPWLRRARELELEARMRDLKRAKEKERDIYETSEENR